jgi:hypothetical protein
MLEALSGLLAVVVVARVADLERLAARAVVVLTLR